MSVYTTTDDYREYIQTLPDAPGVYQFIDETGDVLYVGKSRQLRTRLQHYTTPDDVRSAVRPMLQKARDVRILRTDDEQEALQLEHDLIRSHQPPYNTARKDHSRVFIELDREDENVRLVENRSHEHARYFGPYHDRPTARRMLDTLGSIVPELVTGRTPEASLAAESDDPIRQAEAILSGRTDDLKGTLNARMNDASQNHRYEAAAVFRDRLQAIEAFESHHPRIDTTRNADVVALKQREGQAVLVVLVIRNHRLLRTDEQLYTMQGEQSKTHTIASAYEPRSTPEQLVVDEADEAELNFLNDQLDCTVICPSEGEKRRLVRNAARTAKQRLLKDDITEQDSQTHRLGQLCGWSMDARIVEGVDVSRNRDRAVGATVRFVDGQPDHEQYRRFFLGDEPGDPGAIRMTVERRCQQWDRAPDLLLVDGGLDQVRAARSAWDGPVVGLAKSDERLVTTAVRSRADDDGGLKLAMRIRDEAHRFANEYARVRRERVFESDLQSIEGIGPTLARRLVRRFGSPMRVREASVEKLMDVEGISETKARRISR